MRRKRPSALSWAILAFVTTRSTFALRHFHAPRRTTLGHSVRAAPLPGDVGVPQIKSVATAAAEGPTSGVGGGVSNSNSNSNSSNNGRFSFNIDLSRTQALVLLVAISAIYGTNYTAIKIMDESHLDPYFSTLLRFAIATIVFTPVMLKAVKSGRSDVIIGGMEVGLLNGFGYLFQALSLQQPESSASSVAFISSLSCITVPLLEWLVPAVKGESKQALRAEKIYPALLALGGVACLELSDGSSLSDSTLAAFAQPLFFGVAFYRLERVIKRCSTPAHFSAFTGGNQLSVLLVALIWFLVEVVSVDDGKPLEFLTSQITPLQDSNVMFSLLWCGFVTTAGAALLESLAVKKLAASEVAIVYTTEPLWGTLAAAFILGEVVSPNTIAGGMLIVCACLLSQRNSEVRGISAATAEGKRKDPID